MSDLRLGAAPPETVLPPAPVEAEQALAEAARSASFSDLEAVAARWPRFLAAWASLAEAAEGTDVVGAYAFARTGYHRGLDALRGAGWRGSGYVRWEHPANRGFLRSLDALRRLAGEIGESDEEERCSVFLRQLDPSWASRGHEGGTGSGAGLGTGPGTGVDVGNSSAGPRSSSGPGSAGPGRSSDRPGGEG